MKKIVPMFQKTTTKLHVDISDG